MCKYKRQGWASLGLDLGPAFRWRTIKSVDVSNYESLCFWAKADSPGDARIEVLFVDTHRRSYYPRAVPKPPQLSRQWQRHTVDLDDIRPIVDLRHLTHVAFAFGKDVGNARGATVYVDDVSFDGSGTKTGVSNGDEMPRTFPQHWPSGSVAGTAWLMFVELDVNPFGRYRALPPRSLERCTCRHGQDNCGQYSLQSFIFNDVLTFSANLDASHRDTQFYKSHDDADVFQWDTRMDVWLPPFRPEFSWGPYLRLSGATSDKDYEWINNWGARPGVGLQIYPFSSRSLKEKGPEPYADLARLLGSVRLFVEHNQVHYEGREHSWRPDELVRIGADYWRDFHIDDITKPYWGEIWSGLIWHSTNGFDKDYDTVIFANALRLGIRKPYAGLLSAFTPYLVAESSLSENGEYFWENRLLLGGGIRFAPPLKLLPPGWKITRLVVYAEYLHAAAYYKSSAFSAVPDDDFRIGINAYIGEWWHK